MLSWPFRPSTPRLERAYRTSPICIRPGHDLVPGAWEETVSTDQRVGSYGLKGQESIAQASASFSLASAWVTSKKRVSPVAVGAREVF
jgi:hypothetical protein